jgi:hypothetical protein
MKGTEGDGRMLAVWDLRRWNMAEAMGMLIYMVRGMEIVIRMVCLMGGMQEAMVAGIAVELGGMGVGTTSFERGIETKK